VFAEKKKPMLTLLGRSARLLHHHHHQFFLLTTSPSLVTISMAAASQATELITAQELSEDFLRYVNASMSPFHAVAESARRLQSAGFEKLSEASPWHLQPGHKYFYTRNDSTIVAFAVGAKFQAGHGFHMIGAHTDSPVLRLKPVTAINSAGYLQLGVQTYGGGLWRTWFDRDLSVAGRVVYGTHGKLQSQLICIPEPIVRIPSLAIHLRPPEEVNNESHLAPILASQVKDQLSKDGEPHHQSFLKLLAERLGRDLQFLTPLDPAEIVDFELSLYDTQPAAIGGLHREFIFSPRLDNLMSSFCALHAIINSSTAASLAEEENVRVCLLFDNEEVGSTSFQGAASSLLEHLFSRVNATLATAATPADALECSYSRSFLISADMAHGVHPNYTDKHEARHRPALHKGPVLKHNCNLRYATSSVTAAFIKMIARRHEIPIQEFVVRQDGPCGSTIGPMISAKGVRVVDLGIPQLSMHSIREMCGIDDVSHAYRLFAAFYSEFAAFDRGSFQN
jgi:aspartyl aminopeptidase